LPVSVETGPCLPNLSCDKSAKTEIWQGSHGRCGDLLEFFFFNLKFVRLEPVKRGEFSRKQALELRNATRATPDRLDINPRPIYRSQLLTQNGVPSAHSQTACILLYYRLGDCGAPLEDCNEGCTPHERSQLCEMERYKLHIAPTILPCVELALFGCYRCTQKHLDDTSRSLESVTSASHKDHSLLIVH